MSNTDLSVNGNSYSNFEEIRIRIVNITTRTNPDIIQMSRFWGMFEWDGADGKLIPYLEVMSAALQKRTMINTGTQIEIKGKMEWKDIIP